MSAVVSRLIASAWLLATAMLLNGCAEVRHAGSVKLCRSLVPAFNSDAAVIEIERQDVALHSFGLLVIVEYAAREPAVRRERQLRCTFEASGSRGRPELRAVATESGPLGEVRLHWLNRYWIESGRVAVADPAPVIMLAAAPDLPHAGALALQHFVSALPQIATYALLALAYALLYGLIGRINLAFGEMAILAGYGTFLGSQIGGLFAGGAAFALTVGSALALGLYTSASHGTAFARLVLFPLVGRPGQHVLIATIGMAIVWSEAMRLLQGNGARWLPPLSAEPYGIARAAGFVVTVTPVALLVAATALLTAIAVLHVVRRSSFGRAWRATADDPLAAAMFGVDPQRVLLGTSLLAATLAGLGGGLTSLSVGGVGHAGGMLIGLKALIAAVIGGIGSLPGALVGAVTLGLAETLWSAAFRVESRDIAVFFALAVVLALRPQGLFGASAELTRARDER
jgi:branched-subunit amino acid ABC-type transport system permease component